MGGDEGHSEGEREEGGSHRQGRRTDRRHAAVSRGGKRKGRDKEQKHAVL